MNTRTLATLTLVLAAAGGCGPKPGAASHPKPAPGTALTIDEKSVTRYDSYCPYVSLDGPSLVCFDISSSGWIHAVLFDVGAGHRRTIELVDVQDYDPCGGSEGTRTVLAAGFDAVNQELASRIYQPTEVVLAYDPSQTSENGDPPPAPAPYTKGTATISLETTDAGQTLQLSNGGQIVETMPSRWSALSVVAVDDTHVGVVSHHRVEVWDLAARAPSCASNPRCPSHYDLTREYLAALCDGVFSDESEPYSSTIYDDQASGALAQDDFVILDTAFDALTGAPIADAGLRDFFVGPGASAWLPAACAGRFPSMAKLDETMQWERDMIHTGALGKPLGGE